VFSNLILGECEVLDHVPGKKEEMAIIWLLTKKSANSSHSDKNSRELGIDTLRGE
jgi:hypothetical protein